MLRQRLIVYCLFPDAHFYLPLKKGFYAGTHLVESYGIDLLGDVDIENKKLSISTRCKSTVTKYGYCAILNMIIPNNKNRV